MTASDSFTTFANNDLFEDIIFRIVACQSPRSSSTGQINSVGACLVMDKFIQLLQESWTDNLMKKYLNLPGIDGDSSENRDIIFPAARCFICMTETF